MSAHAMDSIAYTFRIALAAVLALSLAALALYAGAARVRRWLG